MHYCKWSQLSGRLELNILEYHISCVLSMLSSYQMSALAYVTILSQALPVRRRGRVVNVLYLHAESLSEQEQCIDDLDAQPALYAHWDLCCTEAEEVRQAHAVGHIPAVLLSRFP